MPAHSLDLFLPPVRQWFQTALGSPTPAQEQGWPAIAVDLVCQVESPGSVARGLQRVGRAGHLVGGKSKGRLIPKTANDLLDQAVLAREMAAGRVEELRVPAKAVGRLSPGASQMSKLTQSTWPPYS